MQVMLVLGILVFVGGIIATRRVHTEDTANEIAIILTLAAGAFLFIAGLLGVLSMPPGPSPYDETAEPEPVREATPSAVSTAIGVYIAVVALVSGLVVGFAK